MEIEDSQQIDIKHDIRADQGVDQDLERQVLQQNHSHSHSHSRKPRKYGGVPNTQRNWGILFFTMVMPIHGYILQYFWFFELLKNKDGEKTFPYYGNLILMIFDFVMNVQSYYICVFSKNSPYKRAPPQENQQIDNCWKNDRTCQSCEVSGWKTLRCHHCSTCGDCQLKMDHHCPWIDNCVGLRNHQAFLLFTFYMFIGAMQYTYHSLQYAIYQNDKDSFFDGHHPLFFIYWTFVGIIIGPMTMMLFGLTMFHSLQAVQNSTTLLSMSGQKIKQPLSVDQAPTQQEWKEQQGMPPNQGTIKSINIYDQGVLANIAEFFLSSRVFFWIAQANNSVDDGFFYSTSPIVYKQQVARYQLKENYPKTFDEPINEQQIISSFKEELVTHAPRLANKKLKFGYQTFELTTVRNPTFLSNNEIQLGFVQEQVEKQRKELQEKMGDFQSQEEFQQYVKQQQKKLLENLSGTIKSNINVEKDNLDNYQLKEINQQQQLENEQQDENKELKQEEQEDQEAEQKQQENQPEEDLI